MRYIHSLHCHKGFACYCVKDRGYRTQQELKVGDLVTIYDDFKVQRSGEVVMLPGMVAKLEGFSNAGFQGIYAHLRVNGEYVPNVPAGWLLKADDGASARKAVREELDRRIAVARKALTDALEWAAEHNVPEDEVVEMVATRARS